MGTCFVVYWDVHLWAPNSQEWNYELGVLSS